MFVLFTFPSCWPFIENLSKCQLSIVWSLRLLVWTFFQNFAEETTRPVQHRTTRRIFTNLIKQHWKITGRMFVLVGGRRVFRVDLQCCIAQQLDF